MVVLVDFPMFLTIVLLWYNKSIVVTTIFLLCHNNTMVVPVDLPIFLTIVLLWYNKSIVVTTIFLLCHNNTMVKPVEFFMLITIILLWHKKIIAVETIIIVVLQPFIALQQKKKVVNVFFLFLLRMYVYFNYN